MEISGGFTHQKEGGSVGRGCVQIMHIGSYDSEPESVALMDSFIEANGYCNDFSDKRLHHEIYLSDPRKLSPEKWKTVIRHPIVKIG